MSARSGPSPTAPTSVVRNTVGQGKEMSQGNLNGPTSDAPLMEYCGKYYNQLLPILAEKMHQEKVQQEKLKAVKARLNFKEVSQHSESGTPSRRRDLRKRLGSRHIRSVSGSPEPIHGRSESPRKKDPEKMVFKRLEKGVFHRLGDKGKIMSTYSYDSRRQSYHSSRRDTESCYQSSRSKGTEIAPEKHCNKRVSSRRTEALSESKEAFLANFRQQKKCIKDPVKIHHIKQREGEFTEDFVRRFKIKSKDVKGAPEIMRISRFMHGITNPELIKRLHDKIPKSVDEMMKITTHFLRGEEAAGNQERKKLLPPWKQHEAGHKQKFKKGDFKNQHRKVVTCIKELKQNGGKDQPKTNKKGEASNKDKALAILMIQPWQRVARQRIT
ncbi:hypothetical protein Tco_0824900 [Tanacetum coccineum]